MRILRRLASLDWPHLIVEVILIFVGITGALWFDNLKEAREERRSEQAVLHELAAALMSDTSDLHFNLRSSERTLSSIDTVLTYLRERRPYDTTLAHHFGRASVATNFNLNAAAYEYLKSLGLGIISNDTLRVQITRYYEVEVPYLSEVEDVFVNGNWSDVVRPQMLEKFHYRFLFQPASPLNYRALLDDVEFQTALETTRETIKWKDDLTRRTIGAAERLLQSIPRA